MTIDSADDSDHQYESNLESDVRFEIELNHEASQIPNLDILNMKRWVQWVNIGVCVMFTAL